jgi:hypothetical protein
LLANILLCSFDLFNVSSYHRTIYHMTNNSNVTATLRRQKKDYKLYSSNDKIDDICILLSSNCRSVIVNFCNSTSRGRRIYWLLYYTSDILYDVSLNDGLLITLRGPLHSSPFVFVGSMLLILLVFCAQ